MDTYSDFRLYLPSAVLFVISFWICYRERRHGGLVRYLFGGNNWRLALTSNIGSPFSLTMFLFTVVPLGYFYGPSLLLLILLTVLLVALPVALKIISSPGFRELYFQVTVFEKRNFSIVDYVGYSLGNSTKIIFGLITFIFVFLYLLGEFSLIRLAYGLIFPNAPVGSVIFISCFMAICFMYTFLGGFVGILRTDRWQLAYLIVSVFAILHLHPSIYNSFYDNLNSLYTINLPERVPTQVLKHIALSIYMLCWFIGCVDFWARNVCTLQNKLSESLRVVRYSSLALATVGMIMIIVGIQIRSSGLVVINGNEFELPFLVLEQAAIRLSPWAKGFLLAGLSAACFTTIDTLIITFTQTYFALTKRIKQGKDRESSIPNPLYVQIVIFFSATCVSLLVTRANIHLWWNYSVHIIFFLALLIIFAVFFQKVYKQYLGPYGIVLTAILTYVVQVCHFRFLNWFDDYVLFLYVPICLLLVSMSLIALGKRIRLFYSRK